ncbi:VOC family protein [Cytobacillus spongiae]|uniref:VOC family protein n=1 Tax=Cytobacillus spongiae TaxID=2901381 RepID=UPI001F266542|nr:VOC family protein [Cytobacillus spongiae]UII56155.1 VOC family protein [Cytobacillus spongiae]
MKLYPYIFSENAREQAEFYAEVLNGEILSIQTFENAPQASEDIKDKVMHLVLKVGEQTFFMADQVMESLERGNGMDLVLEFKSEEEARRVFEGLSKDGEVQMPFDKMFWGKMFGRTKDRFGVAWQITTEHQA